MFKMSNESTNDNYSSIAHGESSSQSDKCFSVVKQAQSESDNNEVARATKNDYCSSEDDEDDQKTTKLLNIISSKHKEIEQTFTLIKEVKSKEASTEPTIDQKKAYGDLTHLVKDEKVQNIISDVFGNSTTAIIDETLTVIQASSSLGGKHDTLRTGVAKLQKKIGLK